MGTAEEETAFMTRPRKTSALWGVGCLPMECSKVLPRTCMPMEAHSDQATAKAHDRGIDVPVGGGGVAPLGNQGDW